MLFPVVRGSASSPDATRCPETWK